MGAPAAARQLLLAAVAAALPMTSACFRVGLDLRADGGPSRDSGADDGGETDADVDSDGDGETDADPDLDSEADAPPPSPPTRVWNTFLGGDGTDYGHGVIVVSGGDIVVVGQSGEPWGTPVRPFSPGNWDCFVARLDSTGALLWSTFLGAEDWRGDFCSAAVEGPDGDVFVTGASDDTWGAPIHDFSGGPRDAFVARLDGDGALVWHTFLGGGGDDQAWRGAAVVDGSGSLVLVGSSTASWGSPVRAFSGGTDAFVAEVSGDGTLLWHTFLGGADEDSGLAAAVGRDGSLYVTGASSATWAAPLRPFTGQSDGFVARLDRTGALRWSTFLGERGDDEARVVAVGGSGLYVGGVSNASWGTPTRPFEAPPEGFVAKLTATGSIVWNAFLGGGAEDVVDGVAVHRSGALLACGFSRATWGAPVDDYAGGLSDAYAAALSADGALAWNTFLGSAGGPGPDDDYGNALAVDPAGGLVVAGDSDATWGAPVRPYSSRHDVFVARLR